MTSAAFGNPLSADGVRKQGCNRSCLENVARHLCETSDEHETHTRKDTLTHPGIPSVCSKPATLVNHDEFGKNCCVDRKLGSGCGNNAAGSSAAEHDQPETGKKCSAERSAEAKAASCSKPVPRSETSSTCCGSKGCDAPAQDDCCSKPPQIPTTSTSCCSPPIAEEASAGSSCCSDDIAREDDLSCSEKCCDAGDGKPADTTAESCCSPPTAKDTTTQRSCYLDNTTSEDETLCSGECCDASSEKAAATDGTCSLHLQSAFERFESLIRLGQCLCQKMIREFNFCCCCGQTGPCYSHRERKGSSMMASSKASDGRRDACCNVENPIAKASDGSRDACCSVVDTTAKASDRCKKACCSPTTPTAAKASYGCVDACCNDADDTANVPISCGKACDTTSAPVKPSSSACKDACCASEIDANGSQSSTAVPMGGMYADNDIEKATSTEHISLNVSGMTCTGCSRKMLNVLRDIPGISNPHVTFVSGTAAYDFDSAKGNPDDLLPLIEKRTGFKLSKASVEHQELDVLLDAEGAKAYESCAQDGLVSFEKVSLAQDHIAGFPK